MYLNKKTDRIFLTIVESYREKGKTCQRTIESLGYVDELQQSYGDPIACFTACAKELTRGKKCLQAEVTLTFKPLADKRTPDQDEPNRKNIGYAAFSSIYHQLEVDYFLNNRRRYTDAKFNHNVAFKLLVFERVLFPASKRGAWYHKGLFFEKMDFSLDDVYRALPFFCKYKDQYLASLYKWIRRLYQRDTTLVYYDVDNGYYVFDYYDQVLEDQGETLNVDFSRKYHTNAGIRTMMGADKKAG